MRVLRAALCVSILSRAVSLDWRPGYCNATGTHQGVQCTSTDTKGSWIANTQRECIGRCTQCTQCAFISWTHTDCSWFSHCDMFALKNEHRTGHKTLQVRDSSRGTVIITLPMLHGMRPPPPPSPPYPPPPPCERLNSRGPSAVMGLASDLQNVQLIQIGANVGDFAPMFRAAGRSDVGCTDLGATVAADLLRSPNVRGLLVEASPSNYKQLQQNLQSSGLSKRHSAVNAAVCTAPKEMTFYSVADDFADKYPDAPFYARSEINSFNRQHVLAVLGFIMGKDRLLAESFVIETPVLCYDPHKLLHTSDLKPASIDVLIVDAEGMDAEIVLAFLSIPTFRPRAIVAEIDKTVRRLRMRLNTTLLDAGYITEMADSRNLFAWK